MTQDDLAQIVGKSRVLISQWESDDRDITTEDIIKLSEYFCISMDSLVGQDLRNKENNKSSSKLEMLFSKAKDLPEDKQRIILNVTEAIMKDIDEQLDKKE